MASVLDRVVRGAQVAAARSSRRTVELRASPGDAPAITATPDPIAATVFDSFDAEHGGFGTAPKFPLTAPFELALDPLSRDRRPALAHIVEATLDAMGWGELYDEVDGGFFRCAATRDWQRAAPREAARRQRQPAADLSRGVRDAAIARYRERAEDILRFVQTWLADPVDGGWAGSQQADRDYYAATGRAAGRRRSDSRPRALRGRNAADGVGDAPRGGAARRSSLGEFALRSLERHRCRVYRPGAGVAHSWTAAACVRGLLDDQIAMASAHLDAHEATGNIVYEMMAQELVHYALRTMWDERDGGFFDRSVPEAADRIGLLRDRLKPFVANCEAARVLNRVARPLHRAITISPRAPPQR